MIGLLIFLLVVITAYLLYYRYQVHLIQRELKEIQRRNYTNQLLTQEFHSQELNALIANINETIEKERRLNLQMIHHQNALSHLMTHLSHDIRTPLTSLSGFVQLLEQAESETDKERYFAIIYQRLADLNRMLDELFLLMKLDNVNYSIDLTAVDWNEFIKQHLLSHYDRLSENSLQPAVHLPQEAVMINANETLLVRIHDNLLKNILDHGGSDIYLGLQVVDQTAHFTLSNKYPLHKEASAANSGLGLTIVAAAVENMHGSLEIADNDSLFVVEIVMPLHEVG
ncbi:sensor histidine kinase [Fundicoccus culcitae]|uniref:histidine kinase n=1 Tax=Fundicoccus culcitae TaxID=2969821 RepID=A0ABY5P8Z3_9LACT|nr:HAMP domain-containing sensor histidine kinase [Fundicoccus culcitae]UUX34940.1 HAMP domain-containing histidine kinase [Fundicoccus culcitae]